MGDMIEGAMDAVIALDANQRIVVFNRAASQMFGVPAPQALGRTLDRFIPARYRDRHRQLVKAFGRSPAASRLMGQPRQLVGQRADGTEFPMDASISRSGAGSRRLTTVMVRDISRLRAAEAGLAARDAAEADSRAKSALLSRVSHELRTPLNAVLGFAQLMALNPSLDERARDQLAQIQRAGWNLVAMIDDLLKLGGIASGEFDAQCVAADVAEIARLALRTCAPQASQRRVELLDVRRPDAPIRAMADPRRLEQVLQNLVSNAIKYNNPGGWVQISLAATSDDVTIAVEDDGIGMDEGQQAQLFQPFNRLGREAGPEAGSGMGLVLVREMVQRMGGRLNIASQPGLGTQVQIHLRTSARESV